VGKAIGGAISNREAKAQAQAQAALERKAQQQAEEVQERAERLERKRAAEELRILAEAEEAKARATASAARHSIMLNIICPLCKNTNSVSLPSDGQTNLDCHGCNVNMTVVYTGEVTIYDKYGTPLSSEQLRRVKLAGGFETPLKRVVACPICSQQIGIDWLPAKNEYLLKCPGCAADLGVEFTDTKGVSK
jgi:ribosomal protein S27E